MMDASDRHLDLGCGDNPHNPYARKVVCGVDIRELAPQGFEYRVANLALQPIPYADDSFASVSAFDFLEHVPRVLAAQDGRTTHFPFVELMNEIWRVLAPGGRLYALTPGWPFADAFTDPTHVNVLTPDTHIYFCGESPLGRMYGFRGRFEPLRVARVHSRDAGSAAPAHSRAQSALVQMSRVLRHASRRLRGKTDPFYRGRKAYILWELQAIKPH